MDKAAKTKHEAYDKFLRELPKDGFRVDSWGDLQEVDLWYLESCGYIYCEDTEEYGIVLVAITKEGVKFISEGGFEMQNCKVLESQRKHFWSVAREWATLTIALSSLAFTIFTQAQNDEKINRSNTRIDSIKLIIKELKTKQVSLQKPLKRSNYSSIERQTEPTSQKIQGRK